MKLSLEQVFNHHSHIVKTGVFPTIFTTNQLIHLYSKHGFLREAQFLFDKMPQRNVFSWNAIIYSHIHNHDMSQARQLFDSAPIKDSVTYNSMISGYANTSGSEPQAVILFSRMQETGIGFDEFTLTTMLNLTAKLTVLLYGKQLHSYMVKTANDSNPFTVSSLIDMYSKCGNLSDALQVFRGSGEVEDMVSKNAMVAACCREGEMEMASDLFWRDSRLNDVVSWNTLISGYTQNGCFRKALELFIEMRNNGIRWNEHTFTAVLNACSGLRSQRHGMEVHAWVTKAGLSSNPYISSCIVDMYCKCGNITYAELVNVSARTENVFSISSLIVGHSSKGNMVEARKLFDSLNEKNLVVWTALFSGYVRSRQCEAVFELFLDFIKKETQLPDALILISVLGACAIQAALCPDVITFVALLSACRHAGLVELGEKYFASMTEDYDILPEIDHYSCMVDLYGRTNHLGKAVELMKEVPVQLDAVIWGAFLNACKVNKSTNLVREAEEELLRIEAGNAARYVQLANVYAAEGNWSEMCRIRGKMKGGEVRKLAGCSWVYVEKKINIFTSGDRSHLQAEEIYSMLTILNATLVKSKDAPS